jgi:hypothetical protein
MMVAEGVLAVDEVPRLATLRAGGRRAALFVWIATVKDLVDYLGLTLTACGAVATSTLWIAHREMNAIRPIRWWEHLAAGPICRGASVLLLVATQIKPTQLWLCLGTFALASLSMFFPLRDVKVCFMDDEEYFLSQIPKPQPTRLGATKIATLLQRVIRATWLRRSAICGCAERSMGCCGS